MTDQDQPGPAPALSGSPRAAAASFTSEIVSASGLESAATPASNPRKRSFTIETSDIVALGVLCLAVAGALIAVMVGVAFVLGRVPGPDAFKLISACLGSSTVSGIAALIGHRK